MDVTGGAAHTYTWHALFTMELETSLLAYLMYYHTLLWVCCRAPGRTAGGRRRTLAAATIAGTVSVAHAFINRSRRTYPLVTLRPTPRGSAQRYRAGHRR